MTGLRLNFTGVLVCISLVVKQVDMISCNFRPFVLSVFVLCLFVAYVAQVDLESFV